MLTRPTLLFALVFGLIFTQPANALRYVGNIALEAKWPQSTWRQIAVSENLPYTQRWDRVVRVQQGRLCLVRKYEQHYTSYIFEGDLNSHPGEIFVLGVRWDFPREEMLAATHPIAKASLDMREDRKKKEQFLQICGFPPELQHLLN